MATNVVINGGSPGTGDWVDSDSDGLADDWLGTNTSPSIVTGNGFTTNAQRSDHNGSGGPVQGVQQSFATSFTSCIGNYFQVNLKYRSSGPLDISIYSNTSQWSQVEFIPNAKTNTGDAQFYSYTWQYLETAYGTIAGIGFMVNAYSSWLEIDEVYFSQVVTPLIMINNQWEDIDYANSKIRVGSAWKSISGVKQRIGGTWKIIY